MNVEFIDSNVFIYLFDETNSDKRNAAENVVYNGLETGIACISFQVIQETLNILTSKLKTVVAPDDTRRFLENVLVPLWRIMPSKELYYRGLDIQARYRYSFYDSLIIAAGVESGCRTLYSEDLQHGQRIERMTIVNPFKE